MRIIAPRILAAAAVSTAVLAACSSDGPPLSQAHDPLTDKQWSLDAATVRGAWDQADGSGIVVAVIDTGVDLDHPDLKGQLVQGKDFVDGDNKPMDENGHGTHVAGIVAAAANNEGVIGTAPRAKVMPLRVLGADGAGADATIVEAIEWAVDHDADVINLSLGETGLVGKILKGGPLNAAIQAASDAGVVVIAAAGNEAEAGQQYRIDVPVLVVNATNPLGTVALFSNVGDERAISAPGVGILSTAPTYATTIWPEVGNGYESLDGTSMAAPLVSGVAALLLSADVPADQVISILTSTAQNPDNKPRMGAGLIDATAALQEARARGYLVDNEA